VISAAAAASPVDKPTRALVLVGHGSHLNPSSSAPVFEHAARIRAAGYFDEVVEAFWKEEPSLRDALALVESREVYVVPLFLAEGYFTRLVVPRELGIDGAFTRRGTQSIFYCKPIGSHPAMGELILRRALSSSGAAPNELGDSALVIIGHGTDRSPTSGDTVYRLVASLRETSGFGSVDCGFLDESPRIDDVLGQITARNVVLVPFFVAEGWHTAETIPEELALTGASTTKGDQTFRYTPPIGTLPEIAELIVRSATDIAEAQQIRANDVELGTSSGPVVALARRAFIDWIDTAGNASREFLEIVIRVDGAGRYEIRHREDAGVATAQLRASANPRDALTIARTDAAGAYRPLRTAATLRRGWVLEALTSARLWAALSYLYPAAVLHWHLDRAGGLEVVDYYEWAGRQTGAYENLGRLDREQVAEAVGECCRACVRVRLWNLGRGGQETTSISPGRDSDAASVPCREPCTWFAVAARAGLSRSRGVVNT